MKLLKFFFLFILATHVGASSWFEENNDSIGYYDKRNVGALAKTNQFPVVQQRSYSTPPLVSAYKFARNYEQDNFDKPQAKTANQFEKRYLGALAKNGYLNFSKPQEKRIPVDEIAQSDGVGKQSSGDISLLNIKLDFIENLKPVLIGYIKETYKNYDPRKVDLFLENLANTVFELNEEFAMDDIKYLAQSGYFQKETDEEMPRKELPEKRNIQSLVRDLNVSYSGVHHEPHFRVMRGPSVHGTPYMTMPGNQFVKRGTDYGNYNEDGITEGKRHTMFDIHEREWASPTLNYPNVSEQGDVDEKGWTQETTIPIGKRYLGAMARSGWLPRGFALHSGRGNFNDKRYVGALARTGMMYPTVRTAGGNPARAYYLRGGRGFQSPVVGPRVFFLKAAEPFGQCQCKKSPFPRWSPYWEHGMVKSPPRAKNIPPKLYWSPPMMQFHGPPPPPFRMNKR